MKSLFSKDASSHNFGQPAKEIHLSSSEFPKVYRAPHNTFQKIHRWGQSLFAYLSGRPDPHRIIPVTVLTGFLGAGKTTIIVNLMKELPREYRVAWLKNEFGGTAVDSELAADNNIATVKEMLQGCICHVLIGQLGTALEEMLASDPDRIIIETSGSAAPAPIVWEIRKHPRLLVDGIITVIDAVNFPGYKDKSYTAKLQAKYTDLILINKHEQISEHDLDHILDDVYELNPETPKIKTENGRVAPNVLFGLDSRLFETAASVNEEESHVEKEHQHNEVDLIEITFKKSFSRMELENMLKEFSKETFYRIKGVLSVDNKPCILNWAFGSCQITPLPHRKLEISKVVFMGTDIEPFLKQIAEMFFMDESAIAYTPKEHPHDRSDCHERHVG